MASPDSPCGIKEVDIAINYAVEEKDDTYQDLLTRLSAKQKALLIALARSGKNAQPTSGDFIKRYHLSSASAVQRSLSSLQDKDLSTLLRFATEIKEIGMQKAKNVTPR